MRAAMLSRCSSSSSFPSAWLDRSDMPLGIGWWHLTFNIFVILTLVAGRVCWLTRSWIWSTLGVNHSSWLDTVAGTILTFLEVIWKSCTLSILMILFLSRIITSSITLPWNSRQLLLALRNRHRTSIWLNLLIRTTSWPTSYCKSHLLFICIVLDGQLGLACLNLIALLTHSLVGHIIALFLIFFLLAWHLQMSIQKCGWKLILSNCSGQ